MVYNITNLYAAEHHGWQRFLLLDGGVYTLLFWVAQVLIGGLVPLTLFFLPAFRDSRTWTAIGAVLVILGGLAQIYVIIIGGQAYPLVLFPGMEQHSNFFDGVVGRYTPSVPEIVLGLGGTAFALFLTLLAVRVLPFLPASLADNDLPGVEVPDKGRGHAEAAPI